MSMIKGVLLEEQERLKKLAKKYQKEIKGFPKGSISVKDRNGANYCYLAYRDKGKVVFKYLGKENSKVVNDVKDKIAKRKQIEAKLKKVNVNLKDVERVLVGKKI